MYRINEGNNLDKNESTYYNSPSLIDRIRICKSEKYRHDNSFSMSLEDKILSGMFKVD